jgi:hypothetical protein
MPDTVRVSNDANTNISEITYSDRKFYIPYRRTLATIDAT